MARRTEALAPCAAGRNTRRHLRRRRRQLSPGGRSKLFVKPLVIYFGETPLVKIGQVEIDAAAAALLPNALPQTRNRSVYTPALAIIRHAGIVKAIKRPKWTGGRRLDWLRPDDAFKLLEAANVTDTRLGPHDVPAVRRPASDLVKRCA
jgi:hypothetical protein